MSNRRTGSLRGLDLRAGVAVTLLLLCLSSSALATRPGGKGSSPAVSFPARVTAAQSLTLQLGRLTTAYGRHHRLTVAQKRRLVGLSKARARALTGLAAHNPDLALRWLLTPRQRAVLRRVRGAVMERRVTLSGRYRLLMDDAASLDQLVSGNGKHVVTLRAVSLPHLTSDALISVAGYRIRHIVLVPHGGVRVLHAASTAASTTVGTIETAVIAGTFSDSTSTVDMQKIQNVFQSAESYLSEASYGKMTLNPTFYGPVVVPESTSAGCSSSTLTSDLMNAANSAVDFTRYRRLVLVVNCPQVFGVSSSEGPVSTPDGTITAAVTLLDPSSAYGEYFVDHEISHTLGPGDKHASFFVCLPAQFIGPTRFGQGCASDEYDDPFDVLGGGPYKRISQQDPFHKANAGWLSGANYPIVTAPGTTTYTLSPYELPASGPLALDIPRGSSGTDFTVEYRQPVGFDSWMGSPTQCPGCTVTQGASIRLVSTTSGAGGGSDTQLIDTTPGSIPSSYYYPFDDVQDGALTPGRTFTDPEYGISITTVSADASGLTVRVTIPPQTCTHASPTLSAVSPAAQAVSYGQAAKYTFTLTNNDSAGCPANTFRYYSPGTDGLDFVASPDYLTLAPGASATVSLSVSARASATAGTWTFSGIDGRGGGYVYSNSLGTSAAVTQGFSFQLTTPLDTKAPSAPPGLSARALGARAVRLSWQPATDNVGVASYTVTTGSGYLYTTTGTTFVDPNASSSSANTYTVVANDRAGNHSSAATTAATTSARTDLTRPTAPVVTATATDHSVTVSWTPSTDNTGVAYYRVTPCLVAGCVVPGDQRSFTATGLASRSELDLQVVAYDGDGNASDPCCGLYTVYTGAQGTSPPSQPQRFVSTAGTYHRVSLSWAPSTDDQGVDHYDVYRNSRLIGSTTATSYTDTNAGGSGQYYVQAVDASGSLSAPSPKFWFLPATGLSGDTTPPTSAIATPADGSNVSGTTEVDASASDDVAVARVQFYVDGVLKQTDTAAPYTFSWNTATVGDGPHWLYALAYDSAGNYGTTDGAMVTVANSGPSGDTTPPTVALTSPSTGATVSGSTPVSATAGDDVGVTRVDFSVDGVTAASSSAAPYGFTWEGSDAGSHTITATAYDAAGNSSSSSVTVTVAAAADTTPPTVSFGSPTGGATVSGTTTVQVNTSDDVGVASVSLAVDGAPAVTDSSSPWSFSVDTTVLGNGTHTLTATSSDAAGNKASAEESVTVQNSTDIKAPSTPSGLKLAVSGTMQAAIFWSPSTDNAGVAGYNVYRDGVLVAQTTLPNYLDTGLAPGTTHAYTVKAFDAAGNVSAPSSKLSAKTVALSTAATSTIAGVVYGPTGKPLANVVVSLSGNGLTKTAKTNTSGVYKFSSLPAGTYTLSLSTSSGGGLAAAAAAGTSITAVAGQTVLVTSSS